MWFWHPKHADGIVNGVDPDQTALLVWVYIVCQGLPVKTLRVITLLKLNAETVGLNGDTVMIISQHSYNTVFVISSE